MTPILPVPEIAHHMALVPLLALALVGRRDRAWWWLAGAFGVSWLADTATHWVPHLLVSAVYPVTQAAIVAAVLLPVRGAMLVTGLLVASGLTTVLTVGVQQPELLLHTVAWGTAAGLALERRTPFQWPLVVYFGLGMLAWWAYVYAPGWGSWLVYQTTRAVGLGWFTLALWRPVTLTLEPRMT